MMDPAWRWLNTFGKEADFLNTNAKSPSDFLKYTSERKERSWQKKPWNGSARQKPRQIRS
jgi:hypothetical protein